MQYYDSPVGHRTSDWAPLQYQHLKAMQPLIVGI